MVSSHPAFSVPGIERILQARHHDPFSVLGRHPDGDGEVVRAFLPGVATVTLIETGQPMERIPGTDLFEWRGPAGRLPRYYRLRCADGHGNEWEFHDPYCFDPRIGDLDMHWFGEGRHWHAYRFLGAHLDEVDGIHGVTFAVWAPNAERVSVVGDFNHWDGRRHPMRARGGSGVWELFIPGLAEGELYKFELRTQAGEILVKTDPYGQAYEMRPGTAARVTGEGRYPWQDSDWMRQRAESGWQRQPMSIYEVHLGSWQRDERGHFLDYRELAKRLVAHVRHTGFTHIELLPVTEHPLDASWGYQCTGYFAPTSRFGSPDDFRYFVDLCHRNGIGVILDWVPAHFPRDAFALARFDGTALYEHEDPRRGEHRDWGTYIFNFGRAEVKNFLLASAVFWLEEFHLDGLRVDAVASMLYLDYSREHGDWLPNQYGGRENLEAIDFLRELNAITHGEHPGTVMIAEESTAWPKVSRPTWDGGLGFSMKWNMGWMHDTLEYMKKDAIHRTWHHDKLTFGLLYCFTENFVLPFSHDEVVHLKKSMLDKMPGDDWQRFANLRLLYTYQWTYPGKKLLFMGSEFAQGAEWNHDGGLDWYLLQYPYQQGVQNLVSDLNRVYRNHPALHRRDFDNDGFEWISCEDSQHSVISFIRRGGGETCVVILNFTPVPRYHYRVGVPLDGRYRELLNSDSEHYSGSNLGNAGELWSETVWQHDRPHSIVVTVPPLAGVILRHEG